MISDPTEIPLSDPPPGRDLTREDLRWCWFIVVVLAGLAVAAWGWWRSGCGGGCCV